MPSTKEVGSITDLPTSPAIYALCGGRGTRYFAYVGSAENLRRRIVQHLGTRDSSIAVERSAVGLRPEHVTEVLWRAHRRFAKKTNLAAAELIAFDELNPALHSRGRVPASAKALQNLPSFQKEMKALFHGDPTGRLTVPNIVKMLEDLMGRVKALEARA